MARGHGRRRGAKHEEGGNERWLLTYADMITLLMALFMVLFSISSINISKYQVLQHALKAAFSGNILPGGKSIAQQGATENANRAPTTAEAAAIVPLTALGSGLESTSASTTHAAQSSSASVSETAAQHQAEVFTQIKKELDAYAKAHGFGSKVKTIIQPRGLVIRVLTDDLLFASGHATLNDRSHALLAEIGRLLNVAERNPIDVEGNTDDVPIQGGQYPSNWELSTARASTVVRFLIGAGVSAARLTASGYAAERPIASNATGAGRALNRRVEIVMRRIGGSENEP